VSDARLDRMRTVADEVLFLAALDVDRSGVVPLGLVRRCVRLLDDAGASATAVSFAGECDAMRQTLVTRLTAG
jgi:hypothetical protein